MTRRRHCSILLPLLLGVTLLVSRPLCGQAPVDYDDVVVIVNTASTSSVAIGEYFAEQRGIPERHILRIEAPTAETINDAQFEAMRSDVEALLIERNLVDSINYLVTTKGLPLRVNRPTGDTSNAALMARRASVESELMLILGRYADSIGNAAWFYHDYGFNNRNRPFSRAVEGFYLVTRLDAYTVEDVRAMIDRGGPNRLVVKDSVLFVLDREPGARDAGFDQSQTLAAQILRGRGWPVLLNSDTVYVTGQRNVLGYASWGSNDRFHRPFAENATPGNSWSVGALAETFVSTSARSLEPGTGYGQSLIADWLAEGVVGAKGYVFEPFTIALALPHVYLDRYTDESQGRAYNMAESFAMASRTLSWMEVVLGDPKTSIITEISPAPTPSVPDTTLLCLESPTAALEAEGESRALWAWFRGDTTAVRAAGDRFDRTHPLFLGEGKTLPVNTAEVPEGDYTVAATNLAGRAIRQTRVVHRRTPRPDFSLPAGENRAGTPIAFVDETEGEGVRTWDFGDGSEPVTGEDPVHTFSEAGVYFVTLQVDNGGCVGTRRKLVQVRSGTGSIADRQTDRGRLDLAPIPASGTVRIAGLPQSTTEGTIRLHDGRGRLVRMLLGGTVRDGVTELSLAGLPAGVYFLEVETATGIWRQPLPVR